MLPEGTRADNQDVLIRVQGFPWIVDVKRALSERFKPEQIARLGNDHVEYPSFGRSTDEKVITINYVTN